MVIYNSGDSDNLIQALSANIQNAKAVFDKVKQGTQHLSSVIDSGTLSGSAYRAGQSLFQTYITPMIQKLDSAIDDIQSDLDSYKKAEQHVRALDSHLDDNYLKEMLNTTNQLIRVIEHKIQEDKKVIEKLASLNFDDLAQGLAEIPGLEQDLDNLKQLKHDYEKKIQALQTFASSTSSLFTDSLQAFKYALQGVDIINQSKASVDGTITFPAGANMSWSSKLQGEKFSSQPTAKDKLLNKYANDPKALKAIQKLSESMGTSLEEAERLYLSLQNAGKELKKLDKLKTNLNEEVNEFKLQNPGLGDMSAWEFLTKLSGAGLLTVGFVEALIASGAIESSTVAEKLVQWASKAEEVGGDVSIEDIFDESLSEGNPLPEHSELHISSGDHESLPRFGKPYSSEDLIENGELKQRRYYDGEGRAIEDIDYFHSNGDNSHEFPHRHEWIWDGNKSTRPQK